MRIILNWIILPQQPRGIAVTKYKRGRTHVPVSGASLQQVGDAVKDLLEHEIVGGQERYRCDCMNIHVQYFNHEDNTHSQ